MTETPQKVVVDAKTGKTAYVPLSSDEIAERESMAAEAEAQRLAEEQAEAERQAHREDGIATLKTLGLTDEQIIALLGN